MTQVAAIQMTSGPDVAANLFEAGRLITQAVESGAQLIVLPENFCLMPMKDSGRLREVELLDDGHIQNFMAEASRRHKIWLVGGTVPLTTDNPEKCRSSCLVYNSLGERVARYDKIHLFDVELNNSEAYTESATIEAGEEVVVVETPFGRLGLAICYDLRFPELFRQLSEKGAQILAVPSSFTAITGSVHWEVLVRARAIENQAYVLAAAQGGFHANGRETYGDTMIVDPWGRITNRLSRGPGVVLSDVDLDLLGDIRKNLPSLKHRRLKC
ncbi:MAG: carbon-nitrogen hydrolase family protein [Gammaproteobacteria bacterium]|nr:carbon-nitrogen hydrolase family protein [Gammaproteobacteria bacterium]